MRKSARSGFGATTGSFAACLAAVALLAGCAAKERSNVPRPPIPTTVGVSITSEEVTVGPERITIPGKRPININQNANAQLGQAPQIEDATVDFRVSSDLPRGTVLTLEGPVGKEIPVPGTGTASFQIALPTGIYRLSAFGSTFSARLTVEPSRVSSGTSVLTP